MHIGDRYRKPDIECEHGQFEKADQQHVRRPARNLNLRANYSV